MTQDPKPVALSKAVAIGEALHQDLQRQMLAAEGAMQGSIRVELISFYGQAFKNVGEAIAKPIKPGSLSDTVLHDVVFGEMVYLGWLLAAPPVDNLDACRRLAEQWEKIVGRVLESK